LRGEGGVCKVVVRSDAPLLKIWLLRLNMISPMTRAKSG